MNKLTALLLTTMTLFIIGCSDDDDGGVTVDPLVGVWDFTSTNIFLGTEATPFVGTEESCNLFPTQFISSVYTSSWETNECVDSCSDNQYDNQTDCETNGGLWGTTLTLTSDNPDDTPIEGVYAINGNTFVFDTVDTTSLPISLALTYTFTKQ